MSRGWASATLAAMLLMACHCLVEFKLTIDAAGDAADASSPTGDSAGDSPSKLTLSFEPATATELPIGRHQLLFVTVAPASVERTLRLTAAPCLLKLAGSSALPRRELVVAAAELAAAELVIFAPPDATIGSLCTLATPDADVVVAPLALTIEDPIYRTIDLGDHFIAAIDGLKVVNVGELEGAVGSVKVLDAAKAWSERKAATVQAVTYAGGAFGGAWIVATGISGDEARTPEYGTVKLYRISPADAGPIAPWLDLWGKKVSPLTVEDMVWAPVGICPLTQDALYLGAAAADDPNLENDPAKTANNDPSAGDPGGIYCIDATKKVALIVDDKCRALDVDTVGGFRSGGAKGELYTTRWGGYFFYPPGVELTDDAFPGVNATPGHSGAELRFARGGPRAGHVYVIDEWEPQPLVRISPEPYQATHLLDASSVSSSADYGPMAMSHQGPFGELLVMPLRQGASGRAYDLVALFEEAGGVRRLHLIRDLQCGQFAAFDELGARLAVVTADSSCTGAKTAHLFEFDLP